LAIDPSDGTVYTSLADGRIVQLTDEGSFKRVVFFTGGFVRQQTTTTGVGSNEKASGNETGVGVAGNEVLMRWCQREALAGRLAWNTPGERKCGRPLGIRLVKTLFSKTLYFVDAYHGLFRWEMRHVPYRLLALLNPLSLSFHLVLVSPHPSPFVGSHSFDLLKNTAQRLVTPLTTIHTPSQDRAATTDPVALLPLNFLNDLDVSADKKNIYFSDSSYKNTRAENRREVLDGAPRGRLLKYNTDSKQLTVLLCGLHFPNGVQLLDPLSTNSPLLLAESGRFRILKVNVHLPRRAQKGLAPLLSSCGENGSTSAHLAAAAAAATSGGATREYVSTWLDQAPGFIDNIRPDSKTVHRGERVHRGGKVQFFVGLGTKSSQPFSLLWLAYQLKVQCVYVCVIACCVSYQAFSALPHSLHFTPPLHCS
jgi:hypothetical protein